MPQNENILVLLQSEDPDEIREGAYLAGKEKLETSVDYLVRHVASSNIGVQEAVERALEKIGGVRVLQSMLPLLRSDDSPVRNIAMDLLRKVGSTDVATLCDLLHDDDADVRIFISDILGSTGSLLAVGPLCSSLLRDPEVNVRYQAAISLGSLGFAEAEDCLIKALNDEEWVQFAVIDALAKLRSEASIAALSKALGSSTDLVASMIVEALGVVGNIKSVPLLIRHLNKSPAALCNKIIKAVVNILSGPSISLLGRQEGERLRGYMLNALTDEDTEVQDAAISALAYLGGGDAFAAIFEIAKNLSPEKDHDRLINIIGKLASMGYDQALEEAMQSDNEQVVFVTVAILDALTGSEGMELMKSSFWRCSRDVQRAIIGCLENKCTNDDQDFFIGVLENHTDGTIIKSAISFLGRKGVPSEVADMLMKGLEHEYTDVKEAALEACLNLHLPQINERFKEMFKSRDVLTRMIAVYGLGHYDLKANENYVFEALIDPEPDVRKFGIEALGTVCPMSDESLNKILPALQDEHREVRLTAIDVLGRCVNTNILEHLTAAVKDPDPWVRARCVETLGQRPSEGIMPLMMELLEDESQLVVIKTVETLSNLGGEIAFRALLPLVDHTDPEIQRVVEDAMAKIRQEAGE